MFNGNDKIIPLQCLTVDDKLVLITRNNFIPVYNKFCILQNNGTDKIQCADIYDDCCIFSLPDTIDSKLMTILYLSSFLFAKINNEDVELEYIHIIESDLNDLIKLFNETQDYIKIYKKIMAICANIYSDSYRDERDHGKKYSFLDLIKLIQKNIKKSDEISSKNIIEYSDKIMRQIHIMFLREFDSKKHETISRNDENKFGNDENSENNSWNNENSESVDHSENNEKNTNEHYFEKNAFDITMSIKKIEKEIIEGAYYCNSYDYYRRKFNLHLGFFYDK